MKGVSVTSSSSFYTYRTTLKNLTHTQVNDLYTIKHAQDLTGTDRSYVPCCMCVMCVYVWAREGVRTENKEDLLRVECTINSYTYTCNTERLQPHR